MNLNFIDKILNKLLPQRRPVQLDPDEPETTFYKKFKIVRYQIDEYPGWRYYIYGLMFVVYSDTLQGAKDHIDLALSFNGQYFNEETKNG